MQRLRDLRTKVEKLEASELPSEWLDSLRSDVPRVNPIDAVQEAILRRTRLLNTTVMQKVRANVLQNDLQKVTTRAKTDAMSACREASTCAPTSSWARMKLAAQAAESRQRVASIPKTKPLT